MVGNKKQGNATTKIINSSIGGDLTINNQIIYESEPNISIDWETLIECVKAKYLQGNKFKTVLGGAQEIASCYVNLTIVEEKEQKDKEQELKDKKLDRQEWLNSYEEIHGTKTPILPQDIFTYQNNKVLKRQLILGRAGIGKSVLCQYLAYQWAKEGWWENNSFKLLIWIPLRQLVNERIYPKQKGKISLGKIFYEQYSEQLRQVLSIDEEMKWIKVLDNLIREHSAEILYVLDGFDEVANVCQLDGSQATRQTEILHLLLNREQMIITSRPYYVDYYLISQGIKIDRRLENIGFVNKNIRDYVQCYPWKIPLLQETLQSLLNRDNLMRGIAHIPINLALLCRYWSTQIPKEINRITMTELYEGLVGDLLYEYLGKQFGKGYIKFINLTTSGILNNKKIQPILLFLEKLAFLQTQEESLLINKERIANLLEEFESKIKANDWQGFKSVLGAGLLVSSDEQENCFEERREHYFIHLTFQEFLTARYIARIFKQDEEHSREVVLLEKGRLNQRINNQSLGIFMQNHKYDLRYEIVWWFVAGLLKEHKGGIERFFNSLLSEPHELSQSFDGLLWIKCLEECELSDSLNAELKNRLLKKIRERTQFSLDLEMLISEQSYSEIWFDYLYSSPMVFEELEILQTKEAIRGVLDVLKRQLNLPSGVLIILVKLLSDEEFSVRDGVQYALIRQNSLPSKVLSALVDLLSDKKEYVRIVTVHALGGQENLPIDVLNAMSALLSDEEVNVRKVALDALGNQENLPVDVLSAMSALLIDEEINVRTMALDALGNQKNLPSEALNAIANLLSDEREDIRKKAQSVLDKQLNLPSDVLNTIVSLLKNIHARGVVQYALRNQSNLSSELLNVMVSLLSDREENVEIIARDILGNQSNLPVDVLSAMSALLSDKEANVKRVALDVLGNQKSLPSEVLRVVISLLSNEEMDIKKAALSVLGRQLSLPSEILSAIVILFGDKERFIRRKALSLLRSQSNLPSEILGTIVSLLDDKDCFIRRKVLSTLGRQPSLTSEVLSTIVSLLNDEEEDVREKARSVLGRRSDLPSGILLAMISLLNDGVANVGNLALNVLGKQSNLSVEILNTVILLLNKKDWFNEEKVNFINQHLALILDTQVLQTKLSLMPELLFDVILENNFSSKNVVYFEDNQTLIFRLEQQLKKITISNKNQFIQEFNKRRTIWLNEPNITTSLNELMEQPSTSVLLANTYKQEQFDLIKEENLQGDEESLFSFLAFVPSYHPSRGASIINELHVEDEEIEEVTSKFACLTS